MIAMTYPDETCMTLHQDPEKTAASIARISKADAESFRDLHEMFSVKMRPFILSAAFSSQHDLEEALNRMEGPHADALLSFNKLSVNGAIEKAFEHDKVRPNA